MRGFRLGYDYGYLVRFVSPVLFLFLLFRLVTCREGAKLRMGGRGAARRISCVSACVEGDDVSEGMVSLNARHPPLSLSLSFFSFFSFFSFTSTPAIEPVLPLLANDLSG